MPGPKKKSRKPASPLTKRTRGKKPLRFKERLAKQQAYQKDRAKRKIQRAIRADFDPTGKKGWQLGHHKNSTMKLFTFLTDIGKEIDQLRAKIKDRPLKVMSFGCGDGYDLKEFAGHYGKKVELTGVGLVEMPEWKGKKLSENDKLVKWKKASSENVHKKFPKKRFDLVYANLSMMHAPNLKRALINVQKTLRKGGLFIFNYHLGEPLPQISGLKQVKTEMGGFYHQIYWMKKV